MKFNPIIQQLYTDTNLLIKQLHCLLDVFIVI